MLAEQCREARSTKKRRSPNKRQQMEADQAERQQRVAELGAEQARLADELRADRRAADRRAGELGQVQEKQLAARQQVQRQTAAQGGDSRSRSSGWRRAPRALRDGAGTWKRNWQRHRRVEASQRAAQQQLGGAVRRSWRRRLHSGREAVADDDGAGRDLRGEHAEMRAGASWRCN